MVTNAVIISNLIIIIIIQLQRTAIKMNIFQVYASTEYYNEDIGEFCNDLQN